MNYNINEYRNWLSKNVFLSNAYSVESMKLMTHHILMGRNYRLLTENNTKSKLIFTYLWLQDLTDNAKREFGDNWKQELLDNLLNAYSKTSEQNNLTYWLLGLTQKTSVNIGVKKTDFPELMTNLIEYVTTLLTSIERANQIDNAWLLIMAGSATLNIRGSEKSTIGKTLEKVLLRASLSLLGFPDDQFRINVERDKEVDREVDAEVATVRGSVRIDVGLIASGNQEVIEDKIGRVGRNGIVLFDVVGTKTQIYTTAERNNVVLIQMRNNHPLMEMYRHLQPLARVELIEPPTLEQDIWRRIDELPNRIFEI
jgi:hypothetical protein